MTIDSPRKIGPVLATFVVANNMIGSGFFLLPATLANSGGVTAFAWLIGTVLAVVLGGAFARLAREYPNLQSPDDYVRPALGRDMGFLATTLYWVSSWMGNNAIAVAAFGYLVHPAADRRQPDGAAGRPDRADLADVRAQPARAARHRALPVVLRGLRPAAGGRGADRRLGQLRSAPSTTRRGTSPTIPMPRSSSVRWRRSSGPSSASRPARWSPASSTIRIATCRGRRSAAS